MDHILLHWRTVDSNCANECERNAQKNPKRIQKVFERNTQKYLNYASQPHAQENFFLCIIAQYGVQKSTEP
jgi:hypothetical protein